MAMTEDGRVFDLPRRRCAHVAMAGLLVVAASACGEKDGASAGGSDCEDVPTYGPPDESWRPPPPNERAMLVAGGSVEAGTTAGDITDEDVESVSLVLYGDPEAEDPFTEQDLGVWFSDDPWVLGAREHPNDDQRHTTTVRGQEAFVDRSSRDDMQSSTGAAVISWMECDDLAISLRSHSFSVDELVSMADQLQVSGAGAGFEPEALDGLDEVLVLDDLDWRLVGDSLAGPGVRDVTYFGHPTLGGGTYEARTWTFTDEARVEDLRALFRFDHPGARQATVRGRDALLYEWPTSPDLTADERFDVFWLESPTVAVHASGGGLAGEPVRGDDSLRDLDLRGITEAEVLDFVEDLRPATPEEADLLLTAEE